MNKIKEKKLNSIKSQIVEITDFVESSFEDKSKEIFLNKNDVYADINFYAHMSKETLHDG